MEAVALAAPVTAPVTLAAIVAVLLTTAKCILALRCYECSEQPAQVDPSRPAALCADFDKAWRYVVECQHSTFCRKTTVELTLPDGKSIRTVRRDCAPQLHSYQKLENRVWTHKNETVTSLYEEGCSKEDANIQATMSEYCYCKSYLCNSSKSSHDASSYSHHSDAMAVIFVFNAMKYLRSLR